MKSLSVVIFATLVFMLHTVQMVCAMPSGLHDNGDGTITDHDTNLMWLQDGAFGGWMNWTDAVAWASGLSFGGYNDWRLPTALNPDTSGPCNGDNCTGSEMGNLFYNSLGNTAGSLGSAGPFTHLAGWYWSGTPYTPDPVNSWVFGFGTGSQVAISSSLGFVVRVMAVRTDAVTVPEPSGLILLLPVLAGLVVSRKRSFLNMG